jgi:HPr kinase/phosphorylase
LQLRGIDTLKEFIERQRMQMNAESDSIKSQGRLL